MRAKNAKSRRDFLANLAGACAGLRLAAHLRAEPGASATRPAAALPLVDLHVHLDNSSIDQVLPLSRERGVKFGIVEHAGTRENQYPVVLSNDEELRAHIRNLDGKGVYKGVQTEWTDWRECFSREALGGLDYVLTDAMTFPGRDGKRVKLWEKDAADRVDMTDREAFMDRYVDWHVRILTTQPIDILANVSWLPAPLAGEYDRFWTERRIRRVADAAAKHRVALEISSSFKLPNLRFLRIARDAGIKFTFGSNGRYPNMGRLEYSVATARELGLTRSDLFMPTPNGAKAGQRRTS